MKLNLKTPVRINSIEVAAPDGPFNLGLAYRVALAQWAPEGAGAAQRGMRAVELSSKLAKEDTCDLTDSELMLLRECIDCNPAKWPAPLLHAVNRHASGLDNSAVVDATAPKPEGVS